MEESQLGHPLKNNQRIGCAADATFKEACRGKDRRTSPGKKNSEST